MAMKFLGIPYPITQSAHGYFRSSFGINQIKSDLLQLLLTNPGERVMLPNYGTPLKSMMFEQNDQILANTARTAIINAINMWEPRITVTNIDISNTVSPTDLALNDPGIDLGNFMMIKITFLDPENIQEIDEITLELPTGGQ